MVYGIFKTSSFILRTLFGSICLGLNPLTFDDIVNFWYSELLMSRKNTSRTTIALILVGTVPDGTTPGWLKGSEGLASFSYGPQASPVEKIKSSPSKVATSPLSKIRALPSCLHVAPKV